MEVNNTLNATPTVPTDRPTAPKGANQTANSEETSETAAEKNKEAYSVNISAEAQRATGAQNTASAGPEGSEAVQTYTNTGKIAG